MVGYSVKNMLIRKASVPAFYSRLWSKQKKLWDDIASVTVLTLLDASKKSDISLVLPAIIKKFMNKSDVILARYISTERSIINRIEERIIQNGLEVVRHPIEIGFECLRVYCRHINQLYPMIEWWGSADDVDFFILDNNETHYAEKLLLRNGHKNDIHTFYMMTKLSRVTLRKSGDEDELEILSFRMTYIDISLALRKTLEGLNISCDFE